MGRYKSIPAGGGVPRISRPGRRRVFYCESLEARRLLAAGDLDTSFDQDGRASVSLGDGAALTTADVLVQLDGKTVFVGTTGESSYYGNREGDRIVLARVLLDGSLDPSFGPNGTGIAMTNIDADAHAYGAALQDDGKIVVVGTTLETSGINNYQHAVLRFNPDGSLDRSFGGDGILHFNVGNDIEDNPARDVAIQRDGKIVVVGEFTSGDVFLDEELSILRFNPDGSPDLSFGFIGFQKSDFEQPTQPVVALDYNGTPATNPYFGSIVVAASEIGGAADGDTDVLRLNPDGSFSGEFDNDGQASFRYPGRARTSPYSLYIQPGGRIVIAGFTAGLNGRNDFMLGRLNPDGTLDRTFGTQANGFVLTDFGGRDDYASSITTNYSGDRLMVAGSSDVGFALARYTHDGVLDPTFNSDGMVRTSDTTGLPVRMDRGPGRRFTLAGGPNFHSVRYLDDGANMVAIGSFDDNGGSESGPEEAHFLVTRIERLPTPLRVYLNIGGTATPPFFLSGEDYVGVGEGFSLSPFLGASFVDIPANQTFVSLSIRPVDDTRAEGDETAILSIAPDPSYDIGTPAGITLEIHDNDATSLYPIADAYVRDGEFANLNFGSDVLQTRAAAAPGTGRTRESYLKFDLSSLAFFPIARVRLRVFGRLSEGGAPVPVDAFGVSASGWGEQSITYNNRPAASTPSLAGVEVGLTTQTFYDFDVTNFVNREKIAGRNLVTLLLRNAAASDAHVLWSSRGSDYTAPRLIVTGGINAPGGIPRVTQVFAGSTAWTPAFRQSVEDAGLGDSVWGYAIGGGADQLKSLPWGDVDKISIRFNTAVTVAPEHLSVRGVRAGDYAVSGFSYDEENFIATWTLATPVGRGGSGPGTGDKVLLDLDGDIGTGVVSAFQTRYLDGEWVNGADAYDSGDGAPGGDFRFQLNALRGDVDGDGRVAAADLYRLRARLSRRASEPFSAADSAYSPLYDLGGDGRIDTRDVTALRASLFSQLPVPPPVAHGEPLVVPGRFSPVRRALLTEDLTA